MKKAGFLTTRQILSLHTCLLQFIFTDSCTGLCKNNAKYVCMDIFAVIYFRDFLFIAKKNALENKLAYSLLLFVVCAPIETKVVGTY